MTVCDKKFDGTITARCASRLNETVDVRREIQSARTRVERQRATQTKEQIQERLLVVGECGKHSRTRYRATWLRNDRAYRLRPHQRGVCGDSGRRTDQRHDAGQRAPTARGGRSRAVAVAQQQSDARLAARPQSYRRNQRYHHHGAALVAHRVGSTRACGQSNVVVWIASMFARTPGSSVSPTSRSTTIACQPVRMQTQQAAGSNAWERAFERGRFAGDRIKRSAAARVHRS